MKKKCVKTNPRLVKLINELRSAAQINEANVWREIAKRLDSPVKNYAEVNLSKINRYARDGETILVPGKVLGAGILEQSVSVAAISFSESATNKIKNAKGTCMSIEELIENNPKGNRVRILR